MNPLKYAYEVVRYRGVEIDQTKIKAIQNIPPPKNIKKLRGLQGCLAYIRRFISKLASCCHLSPPYEKECNF